MRSRAEAISDVGKMALGAVGAFGASRVAPKIHRSRDEDMSRIALSAGSVGSRALAAQAVLRRHLNPYHHSNAQHHNDVTFWLMGNTLCWSNGEINLATGVSISLNGGTQTTPNTGVSALIGSQSNPAGNYVVLNSTGSSMTIYDPGIAANITIPAYSASGGTGGQTTGFGVLSSAFNWQARPGGGSASLGPPAGLVEIGKIDQTVDAVSGQYALKTRHGSGIVEAQHIREGGVAGRHLSWQFVIPQTQIYTLSVGAGAGIRINPTLSITGKQAAAMIPGGWELAIANDAYGHLSIWSQPFQNGPGDGSGTQLSITELSYLQMPDPTNSSSQTLQMYMKVSNGDSVTHTADIYIRWAGLSTN